MSAERRLATCQQCHPAATAGFAKYQPHANKHDRAGNAPLYFTARFMETLLLGVFGFFGVHTTLWFRRSWAERMHGSHATSRVPLDSPGSADAVEPSPDAPVAPSQETPNDPSRR